jgi:hypothetical protein
VKRRYPLAGLHTLREDRVRQRASELATRKSEALAAERKLAQARALEQHEAGARQDVLDGESARLEAGQLRASDLAQARAFDVAAAARAERLASHTARAGERVRETEAEQRAALDALARAHADEQVTLGHRSRWERHEARREELAEEEAAHDRVSSQHGKKSD